MAAREVVAGLAQSQAEAEERKLEAAGDRREKNEGGDDVEEDAEGGEEEEEAGEAVEEEEEEEEEEERLSGHGAAAQVNEEVSNPGSGTTYYTHELMRPDAPEGGCVLFTARDDARIQEIAERLRYAQPRLPLTTTVAVTSVLSSTPHPALLRL